MKKFFIFIQLFICFHLKSEIIETNSLSPIKKSVSTFSCDALILFDVDETLIVNQDLLLRPCGRKCLDGLVAHYSQEGDAKKREMIISTVILQRRVCLIDPSSVELIQCLQNKGAKVIALTALKTGPYGRIPKMEQWRAAELHQLGFDFNSAFPHIPHMDFSKWNGKPRPPVFHKGILCTSLYPKGEVLAEFLRTINWRPSKVIVIDDRLHNVQSVEMHMEALGIPCSGYHYTGSDQLEGNIDIHIAEFQLHYLLKTGIWLSDSEAEEFMIQKC